MAAFFSISKPLKNYIMKILLGAIVTQMAGSVGGQTVRRSQNGQILYNKSQKRNTSAISKNTQVRLLQTLMTKWLTELDSVYLICQQEAIKNVYYNKFGQPKYLNTYNYYISAMIKLNLVSDGSSSKLFLTAELPSTDLIIDAVSKFESSIFLTLESGSEYTYFILSVFVTKRATITPNAKMSKIIYAGEYVDYDPTTAYANMQNKFYGSNTGNSATFFVQAVARNGYSGGTTFLQKVEIT